MTLDATATRLVSFFGLNGMHLWLLMKLQETSLSKKVLQCLIGLHLLKSVPLVAGKQSTYFPITLEILHDMLLWPWRGIQENAKGKSFSLVTLL